MRALINGTNGAPENMLDAIRHYRSDPGQR